MPAARSHTRTVRSSPPEMASRPSAGDGDSTHGIGVAAQHLDFPARLRVPEPQGAIPAGGEQQPAGAAERHRRHLIAMACQAQQFLCRGRIPDAHGAILAAGGNALAVRSKRQAADRAAMAGKGPRSGRHRARRRFNLHGLGEVGESCPGTVAAARCRPWQAGPRAAGSARASAAADPRSRATDKPTSAAAVGRSRTASKRSVTASMGSGSPSGTPAFARASVNRFTSSASSVLSRAAGA